MNFGSIFKRLASSGAILALSLGLWAGGCEKKAGSAAGAGPASRPAPPVSVATAVSRDLPVFHDEIGHCVAFEMVNIQSQVAGTIESIHFEDGAELKKGDLLFVIDPRPYQATLEQTKATLQQRIAERDVARNSFSRVESVSNPSVISKEEFDSKKGALAIAEAQVNAAEANVRTAQLRLDYCTIRSPIEGRAGHRLVDVGNVVKENGDPLVRIERLTPIYAEFNVPERMLPLIREKMDEGVLKTLAWLPEVPDRKVEGSLTFLDNAVSQGAGSVKLRATLKNESRYFWAGQFVNVRLVLSVEKGAVLVPTTATQVGQTGTYVYVVNAQSQAELRPVKLGQKHDEMVHVLTGLKPGETVVVSGQMMVVPGSPVMVLPSAAPPAPPATASPANPSTRPAEAEAVAP